MRGKEEAKIGLVLEALPNLQYKVKVGETILRAYTAGRMVINKIRIIPGDKVAVVVSGEIGRIVKRL